MKDFLHDQGEQSEAYGLSDTEDQIPYRLCMLRNDALRRELAAHRQRLRSLTSYLAKHAPSILTDYQTHMDGRKARAPHGPGINQRVG